ncbi:hypothetical protein GIB67_021066 [Kingdonia uniflora]|uniref:TOG domain-containing protein n=1 Tax=Kingdonia uniflora TaxID=39325 RepID=A0A7J7N703_9MAGN|nr:hypothetical protein GIB67_021066 [Kingdonia uniflora]
MSSQAPKPSKPSKPPPTSPTPLSRSSSSSLSSHFAMIELKQRVLTSLNKLSDRDTHQIAVEDLEKTIQSLSQDSIPMLLNCLYDATNDPKPSIKKESLRLLAFLCCSHADLAAPHLAKIISNIVKRLKESDSGVRDAFRDAIGVLSLQYLSGNDNGSNGSVVSLFVKPLFDAMGEQNKVVQAGSAMCMAKMVECAVNPPVAAFQKLCPKICKFLSSQNYLAKAALLPVVTSISQVGAIAPQSLPMLLPSIHECLQSSEWGTRKAAADTLSALASHSSNLIVDGTSSTIAVLESSRFDKVKPVRDSINEALQLWKKISEKGVDEVADGSSAVSHDGKGSHLIKTTEKLKSNTSPGEKRMNLVNDASNVASPTSDSLSKSRGASISDRTVGILKKKVPNLSDKELNPDFFQKLEKRVSDDLPVEVVVPRRCLNSSHSQGEEELDQSHKDFGGRSSVSGNAELDALHGSVDVQYHNMDRGIDEFARDKWTEQRVFRGRDSKIRAYNASDRVDVNQRDTSSTRSGFSRSDDHVEGSSFINNKGNWLAIQRQLSQLERQQAHLMNMLQDFMGGSHNSMITLENRVRGLERVVEDMARDLAGSSGRRPTTFMNTFEGSSNRVLGKYNGFPDYSGTKLGRAGDGRATFSERFLSSDSYSYDAPRNGHMGSSRRGLVDVRSPTSENDGDQVGNRRAWDKGSGSIRLGEGPSARSVWQASKDEATLEAIRGAGEEDGQSQGPKRVAIPELTAEAMEDEDGAQDTRGPVWASWSNAMDALHVGDMDTAYAEVLSTGDDLLLVKLMERSGPIVDQLSNEITDEVLHFIAQCLVEQNLFDLCLSWIQQLADLVMENGPNVLGIPTEIKNELLLNLNEASLAMDAPEDWEGATSDQLLDQLASSWGIDLQHFEK